MFGERYFATRERLSDVIHGIVSLARETHTDLAGKLRLQDVQSHLNAAFLLVVIGDINTGRSTLINALFGSDLCRVSPIPETTQVTHYQFGTSSRDVETSARLAECYRPMDFLQDFQVVDTPGTNSKSLSYQETLAPFLPNADLILIVLSVTNPWSASTWNTISTIPAEAHKRIIIVIQQMDLRKPEDLQVILGHVTDLSLKRLGYSPPIFAVSSKTAYEAKVAVPFNQRALQQSGHLELENFISQKISTSNDRRNVLEIWRNQAALSLRSIEDQIENQTRELASQDRFLNTVEREIDSIRERFILRLPFHLESVAEVFQNDAVWVSKHLHRRLGALFSFYRLFIGDRTSSAMETIFIERLQAAVEAAAKDDSVKVIAACHKHWEQLGERVHAAIGVELDSVAALDITLANAQQSFIHRLGRAARHGIGNLKVRNRLDKDLRRRSVALKSFIFMTLSLLTLGGVCGILEIPWVPLIFCSLALIFFMGGVLVAWLTRRMITDDFQKRLLDTCGGFASTLRSDYEEALCVIFQDYAASLGIVRNHLIQEKLSIQPRLRRWQHLFLTLKAVEQEL